MTNHAHINVAQRDLRNAIEIALRQCGNTDPRDAAGIFETNLMSLGYLIVKPPSHLHPDFEGMGRNIIEQAKQLRTLEAERTELQRLNEDWHSRNIELRDALKNLLDLVDDFAKEGFIIINDDGLEEPIVAIARAVAEKAGAA